jgi:two-component system, cell cycle sensor histidine kinase and response regulator CckA
MQKQELARIFEPFYTTKPLGEGTGLGLASVYGAVKQNRGYIWAYSEPGQGSVFKIYLPIVHVDSPRSEAREETPQPAQGTETVLIVDDEESVRRLTGDLLRSQGYRCLEAAGAKEALELASSHREPIHLVIADVVMPGMSGLELSQRLASVHPESRVLFISGYSGDEVIRRGLLRPGLPFLEKPFPSESLFSMTRHLLDRKPGGSG